MSGNSSSSSSSGIGFVGLLTILLVGLKLTHNIDWSWWWVSSPFWISALVGVAVVSTIFLVAAILDLRRRRRERAHRERDRIERERHDAERSERIAKERAASPGTRWRGGL
ncbi:hypothetical protein [Methylobacterium sp. 37f]|uniref:hypothetical protein n=1 Tax=Methylobacterium sp. 37f TaxID=2817058 RepID=UPI001FFD0E93|nr:hypothetical protein [Methylobacterium sp. 37f]